MTSSADLLPRRSGLHRHQPTGPVGMSLTLDCCSRFCPLLLQCELRSPASLLFVKSRTSSACHCSQLPLGSRVLFKHCFFKAPGECHGGCLLKVCWPTCLTFHRSRLLPLTPKVNSALITFSAARLPPCFPQFLAFNSLFKILEQTVSLQTSDGAGNRVGAKNKHLLQIGTDMLYKEIT